MGDFNTHNDLWHSEISRDQRNEQLADEIDESDCGIRNKLYPTAIAENTRSSPVITLVSLLPSTDWKVETAKPKEKKPNRKKEHLSYHQTRADPAFDYSGADLRKNISPMVKTLESFVLGPITNHFSLLTYQHCFHNHVAQNPRHQS